MNTRLIGVDAETYYDPKTKYSLTSIGAEAYIRDQRFEEIGWAVRVEEADDDAVRPAKWMPANDWDAMHEWLLSFEMDRPGTIVLAHNGAGFDFMILAWKHGILPWRMVDTLQMSRWRYGRFGPGGDGNALAKLAAHYGVGYKGTEVVDAMGKRLRDFTPASLRKYGQYCCSDVNLMMAIFRRTADWFQPVDFTAMHLLANMSADARIHVDIPLIQTALAEERKNKGKRLRDLAQSFGLDEAKLKSALMSNPKFATLLENMGVDPVPMKISKTTGKPTFAFAKNDPEMMEMLESDDEDLADLVGMRIGLRSTIMESRMERFIDIGSRGTMPAAMRIHGAVTGRASADGGIHKGQLHNIPKRANARNALRVGLRAGPGKEWYAADSGQIEVRVLAELAGETDLQRVFQRGAKARSMQLRCKWAGDAAGAALWARKVEAADPYLGLGPTLFRREITRADKFERNVNKAAILAAGFKQGAKGFHSHCRRNGLDITPELAELTIAAYRDKHYYIGRFWKDCKRAVAALAGDTGAFSFGAEGTLHVEKGWLTLPSGRRMEYRDCKSSVNQDNGYTEYSYTDKYTGVRKYLYDGKLTENIVQAVAYDVMIWQAAQILKHEGESLVLFTHDELAYIDEQDRAEYWEKLLTQWMRKAPPWMPDISLDCEFGHGPTYADV